MIPPNEVGGCTSGSVGSELACCADTGSITSSNLGGLGNNSRQWRDYIHAL